MTGDQTSGQPAEPTEAAGGRSSGATAAGSDDATAASAERAASASGPWSGPTGELPGFTIVRVDAWVTAVFALISVGAAVWSGMVGVALAVDLGLFAAGCLAFAWAYLRAIGRSREEAISLGGLFFLVGGVAPTAVARWLWGILAVQTVVAVATAAARPFSSLAFGVLAPMFGLAMLGLWGALHGRFPGREPERGRDRAS